MEYENPPSIPEIHPVVAQPIMLGVLRRKPELYIVKLTTAGMWLDVEMNGTFERAGHTLSRHEAMEQLILALHAASAGTVHLHDPLMAWFAPGIHFRGTHEQTFRIIHGCIKAFEYYHTVREDAYSSFHAQMEMPFAEVDEDTSVEASVLRDWESTDERLDDLVRQESLYARHLRVLGKETRLYGVEDSIVSAYAELVERQSPLMGGYH